MADAKHRTSPDLASQLAAVKKSDRRCGIVKILDQISVEDGRELVNAIDNPHVSPSDLTTILRDNGFEVSEKMIYRHRNRGRNGCRCPR